MLVGGYSLGKMFQHGFIGDHGVPIGGRISIGLYRVRGTFVAPSDTTIPGEDSSAATEPTLLEARYNGMPTALHDILGQPIDEHVGSGPANPLIEKTGD